MDGTVFFLCSSQSVFARKFRFNHQLRIGYFLVHAYTGDDIRVLKQKGGSHLSLNEDRGGFFLDLKITPENEVNLWVCTYRCFYVVSYRRYIFY